MQPEISIHRSATYVGNHELLTVTLVGALPTYKLKLDKWLNFCNRKCRPSFSLVGTWEQFILQYLKLKLFGRLFKTAQNDKIEADQQRIDAEINLLRREATNHRQMTLSLF